MTFRIAGLVSAGLISALALAPTAHAQRTRREPVAEVAAPPPSALAQAEQAYLDVDFATALTAAQEALREGGHTPQELMRIYQLLGVCSAAEGHAERARDFFLRMLAIDPDAELDDTVPPRLRAPFLEARGIVGARPARLGAEVGIARAQSAVHVAFTDPFQVGQTVVVHARIEGQAEFTSSEERARASIDMPLAGSGDADRVEYWLEVRDPFGNQVLTLGTEFEPRVVGRMSVAAGPAAGGGGGGNVLEEPWFWIVVGVVVAGGATAGAVLGVQASQLELRSTVDFRTQ
jgi:hypothetical protein